MWLHAQQRVCLLHVFKTGGTSLQQALGPSQPEIDWKEHTPARILDSAISDFREWASFAVVRNSWDWVVSHYEWILQQHVHTGEHHEHYAQVASYGDFETFLWRGFAKKELPFWWQTQSWFLSDWDGNRIVRHVGRFEKLHETVAAIELALDRKLHVPHLYRTQRRDYRHYYTDATEALVGSLFAEDVETFDFTFDKR